MTEPQNPEPQNPEPQNPEDRKIITLAKAARARTGASQGACVRDSDGRTYAATSVHTEHLQLSGVAVAMAMAISSGAVGLEAVALAADVAPTEDDFAVARDLPGSGVLLWHVSPKGEVQSMTHV